LTYKQKGRNTDMATQTFSAGTNPHITLADCEGDVSIEAWDERSIAIEAEEGAVTPSQEGETLAIRGARGHVHLRVPGETAVTVQGQRGGVRLHNLYGAALVDGAESFRIEGDGNWRRWLRAWGWGSHDVEVRNVGAVDLDYVIGNLTLSDVGSADARAIGGNATVQAVKGDLRIKNVGGSGVIEEVGGDLEVGNVGGNCDVRGVDGKLQITNVGGNADVRGAGAVLKLGNIGGNLTLNEAPLSSGFATDHSVRVAVGGNARLELPDQPNLTVHAIVGGSVSGEGVASHGGRDADAGLWRRQRPAERAGRRQPRVARRRRSPSERYIRGRLGRTGPQVRQNRPRAWADRPRAWPRVWRCRP
jgi:hypothetical protein